MTTLSYYILVFFMLVRLGIGQIEYSISESAEKDSIVGNILRDSGLINEYDASIIRVLRYSLVATGSLPTDFFKINNRTSELSIAKQVDRDSLCETLSLCCDVSKCAIPLSVALQPTRGENRFIKTVKVNVEIRDENDNPPKFQSREIEGHISEAAAIGSTVSLPSTGNLLLASDRDAGINGVKNYSIISPTGTFGLRMERDFGAITDVAIVSLKAVDREQIAEYKVMVVVRDGGSPARSDTVTVNIKIQDANDNSPVFGNDTYTVSVNEDIAINTSIITVHANDLDSGPNGEIEYSIRNHPNDVVSKRFTINPITGEIRTKSQLNFEDYPTYHIIVQASDKGITVQKKTKATVTVNLLDVNDHSPVIKLSYLTKSGRAEVSEASQLGTFVAFVIVSDPEKDVVSCEIDNPMFRITKSNPKDPNEYHLVTAHKLDRELVDQYQVTLTCVDQGKPPLRTAETFTVYVLDANDKAPKFTQSSYTASINENNRIGAFLLAVTANDEDSGENARMIYSLGDNAQQNFTIDSSSGKIFARRSFDREEFDNIHFKVFVRDNGTSPQFAESSVVIRILDENDNKPVFHDPLVFEISEAAGAGVMLGQMSATDADVGRNRQIRFQFQDSKDAQSFDITPNGLITTNIQLDREKQSVYYVVVIAKDNGTEIVQSSSATVRIDVTDINDNPPIIHFPSTYNNTVYISYLEPAGHTVTRVNATDIDMGKNAFLDYSFTQGNDDGVFKINQNTGTIMVAREMHVEDAIVYKLAIRVMDRDEPHNSNAEILNIVVDGTGKAISISGKYLDSIASNRNLIIVICLAAVSGVLALILIIAIVCIRKKDQENHRYSVKTETQRIYEKRGSICSDKSNEVKCPPLRKEVSFSMEADSPMHNGAQNTTYSTLKTQPSWNSSINPKALEHPRACSSLIQTPENEPVDSSNQRMPLELSNHKFCYNRPWPIPEVPDGLAQVLYEETCVGGVPGALMDTDSDVSHADSGRGASDDDVRTTNGGSIGKGYEKKRVKMNHVVSSPSSPPPAYSALNEPPTTPLGGPLLPDRSYLDTIGAYSSFKAPRTRTDASPSQIYASLQRSRKYSGQSEQGMYSCTDMDSVLDDSYRTPRMADPYRTKDDLNSSLRHSPRGTNSPGQNTLNSSQNSNNSKVDAEDLCNQIDNLFFRDVYV